MGIGSVVRVAWGWGPIHTKRKQEGKRKRWKNNKNVKETNIEENFRFLFRFCTSKVKDLLFI